MPSQRRIIGIDFDDVLADFNASLSEYHNNIHGTSYKRSDIVSYGLKDLWRCSHEEAVRRVNEFYHSRYHENLAPVKGAVQAVDRLKRENALVIITSRPESMREKTLEWIHKHFPRTFKEIHFLGHYHGAEARKETKGEMCRKIGVKIFIDDSLEHAISISKEGVRVLLFNAPWNKNKKLRNVVRVFGWSDVLNKLRTL